MYSIQYVKHRIDEVSLFKYQLFIFVMLRISDSLILVTLWWKSLFPNESLSNKIRKRVQIQGLVDKAKNTAILEFTTCL